ncbi:multidrug efflux SMR transporter [Parasphingopyxis algicola]|nr:multidrug efflux SMR transporter [Parasphingopyxis algicola]
MNAWALLGGAILFEILGTSLLKASAGFAKPLIGMASMASYAVCFWLLAFAITRIPVGVAYAVWAGVGIAIITLIGWVIFRQTLSVVQLGCIALIFVGAIGLHLTTATAEL